MEKQPKFDYSDIKFKDNGKLKLIIVVGTRPEIIRLAAVINKCRQYFDVILAHTLSERSDVTFLSSTWRPATAAKTNVSLKRPIAAS